MPELSNPQHEQFARLMADGMAKVDAYAQVFPQAGRKSALNQGCLLSQQPGVFERIRELLEATEEEAVWSLAQRLEYLRKVAMTSHAEMNPESPICRGMKRTPHGVEYRMPDKLSAVALYGKLAGDLDPQAGPARDLMGEMIGAIRSNTWKKRAAEPKKGQVLENWRHERFAQLVGSGERVPYAYEKVYEAEKVTAMVEGYRVAQRPEVAERIAGIRQAGAAAVGWTRKERMRYLRELAEMPIGEIDEASCYCQGVKRGSFGDEIKTPDKVKAVALYSVLAKVQQKRKAQTIEEMAAEMRSRGNLPMADATERSLIKFVVDTVG